VPALRALALVVSWSAALDASSQDLIACIPGTQANSGGVRCRILGDATGDGVAEVIYSSANANTSYGSSTGLVRVFRGTTFQLLQSIEGTVPWAHFGIPAEGVGDVDGDGLSEMLVGAPDLVGPAPSAGVGELRVISVVNNTVLWTSLPSWPSQRMSAAGVGDIDADGIADVASGISLSATVRRVSVQSGVDGHELLSISGSGFLDGESFGSSVGGTGDVDGDGVLDVISWAFGKRVWVNSGASGVLLHTFTSPYVIPSGWFANQARIIEDVDADGRDDIVISDPRAIVLPAGSVGALDTRSGADGSLLWRVIGQKKSQLFGERFESVGDFNGDGIADLAVATASDGTVALGAGKVTVISSQNGIPLQEIYGSTVGENFGGAVDGGSDVNGDAYPDLLVGVPNANDAGPLFGALRIYSGMLTYGTASAGPLLDSPKIRHIGGLPILGNVTFAVTIENGPGASPGLLLIGAGATSIATGSGTLLVDPIGSFVINPILLGGVNGVAGSGSTTIQTGVPNVPTWAHLEFFAQAWLSDASAPGGFTHTEGLKLHLLP
jgi:hypothetical protein